MPEAKVLVCTRKQMPTTIVRIYLNKLKLYYLVACWRQQTIVVVATYVWTIHGITFMVFILNNAFNIYLFFLSTQQM